MSGKTNIKFFGDKELLKKIEAAGANVEEACKKALVKSAEIPKNEMLNYIKNHYLSGETEKSFEEEVKTQNGIIYYRLGFSIKKGGIAALFLNLGTPKISPSFFIDNAVDNNIDAIKKTQLETLKKCFSEL